MRKLNEGVSLIELLIYSAILATVLLVTYEFFVQTSLARLAASNESAIYLDGRRVIFDLEQTIRRANNILSPAPGTSEAVLSLNGGMIIYEVDENGSLIKRENGEVDKLTSGEIMVENLIFQTLGPSTAQPTVKITFTLRAAAEKQGKARTEDFQTAVSLR